MLLKFTYRKKAVFNLFKYPKLDFSSFKSRIEVKARLKEFYKFTHPDLFGLAPEEIQETNSDSMKSLNEFLRNVSTESIDVENVSLTFYIKPGKQSFVI